MHKISLSFLNSIFYDCLKRSGRFSGYSYSGLNMLRMTTGMTQLAWDSGVSTYFQHHEIAISRVCLFGWPLYYHSSWILLKPFRLWWPLLVTSVYIQDRSRSRSVGVVPCVDSSPILHYLCIWLDLVHSVMFGSYFWVQGSGKHYGNVKVGPNDNKKQVSF